MRSPFTASCARAGATPATVNARFTAKQLADSPTTMLVTVTPPVAVALANHPLSDEYHLWSLQGIVSGAAAAPLASSGWAVPHSDR